MSTLIVNPKYIARASIPADQSPYQWWSEVQDSSDDLLEDQTAWNDINQTVQDAIRKGLNFHEIELYFDNECDAAAFSLVHSG